MEQASAGRQDRDLRRIAAGLEDSGMDLSELQQKVDEAVRSFGGYWGEFELLARLTEELGEVARDLQRQRGMRPRPQKSNLTEEVGDLLFTLAAFANLQK